MPQHEPPVGQHLLEMVSAYMRICRNSFGIMIGIQPITTNGAGRAPEALLIIIDHDGVHLPRSKRADGSWYNPRMATTGTRSEGGNSRRAEQGKEKDKIR